MIALYERVSTEEQAQSGFSLEAQKERLEAYCKSQGWTDFEHFTDDGYSGTTMNRPALQRLIRYVERQQVETVIVYKLDRLGRKQKDVLFLLEDVFDKHGVGFKSATEPFDTSTPLGRAMLGILAVFGQLERDTIIERTKFGLRQRARQGLWPTASFPFGYALKDGILHVVPHEAQIVREVFNRFIKGESRKSIAEWMQKRVPHLYIDHYIILKMIKRRTYLGQIPMRSDVFEGKHEAIIDEVTFQAAQKELQSRLSGKPPRGVHLLSTLMVCGECGSGVNYFTSRQKKKNGTVHSYRRVICTVKKHTRGCDTHSFLAKDIEESVIQSILDMNVHDIQVDPVDEKHENAITEIETALSKLQDQQNRLLDAVQDGALPLSMIKERLESIEADRRGLQSQLDDMIVSQNRPDAKLFQAALQSVHDVWDDLNFEEKCESVRLLIRKIRIYKSKRIEIEWAL